MNPYQIVRATIAVVVVLIFASIWTKDAPNKRYSHVESSVPVSAFNLARSESGFSDTVYFPRELAASSIQIQFGTHGKVAEGSVQVVLDGCFLSSGKFEFVDNGWVTLFGNAECALSGEANLTVETDLDNLALWAHVDSEKPTPRLKKLLFNSRDQLTYGAMISRIWFGEDSRAGIWLLGIGVLLLGFGVYFVSSCSTGSFSIGLIVSIAGISLLYTLTVPPLHAPDEPDHVIDFARISGHPYMINGAKNIADRIHYSRTACSVDEILCAEDLQTSTRDSWPAHVTTKMASMRSPLSAMVWSEVGKATVYSTSTNVLILRIFNVAVFVLALGIFLSRSSSYLDHFCVLAMVLVPTYSFFVQSVSNHSLLISLYLTAALLLWSGIRDTQPSRARSFVFGLTLASICFAGRSGILFVGPSLLVFALCADRMRVWQSLRWVVFGMLPIVGCFYSSGFLGQKYLVALLVAPLLVGLFSVVWHKIESKIARSIFNAGTGLLVLSFFVPLIGMVIGKDWNLRNIESLAPAIEPARYVYEVGKSFLFNWGPGGSGFYLFESYFGGFGCPETFLHPLVTHAPKAAMAIFLLSGVLVSRDRNRKVILTICAAVALYLGLLAYGVASLNRPFNLHGRYLTGFYYLLLMASSYGLVVLMETKVKTRRYIYVSQCVFFALVCIIHWGALKSILGRYLGS